MSQSVKVSLAGFLATAVAFGPARMGYGLFLPDFRAEFALSTEMAGFIASAAFAAFLAALFLAGLLTANLGPRAAVVAGGLAAFSGMALVALSPHAAVLAVGVALAASSAGLSWAPYNAAAERAVPEHLRGRVLSVVSTGTTFGIAAAGALALAMAVWDLHWRLTWALFAASGLAAAVVNALVLRPFGVAGPSGSGQDGQRTRLRSLARAEASPLVVAALSFGVTSAAYLSFAVDHIERAGGLQLLPASTSGPILFVAFGIGGAVGLLTGDVERRIGIAHLLRIVFLSSFLSLILLATLPGSWPAALASAALQGGCVMTISAVFSFWSLRMFPNLPAISFTAVLVVYAAGNVAGPALTGVMAGHVGLGTTLVAAAALSLVTALTLPRHVRRQAA